LTPVCDLESMPCLGVEMLVELYAWLDLIFE